MIRYWFQEIVWGDFLVTSDGNPGYGSWVVYLITQSTPKTGAMISSETLVTTHKTARCHNPEEHDPQKGKVCTVYLRRRSKR
jgi:hypothetical protein